MGLLERPAVGGLARGIGEGLLGMQQIEQNQKQMQLQDQTIRQNEVIMKKQAEQEKWDKTPMNVRLLPQVADMPEQTQKELLEWGYQSGYWDENGIGERAKGMTAYQKITEDPDLLSKFNTPKIQAKEAKILELTQQLNEGQFVLAPEKKAKLQQEIAARTQDYAGSLQTYQGRMRKLLGEKQVTEWKPQTQQEAIEFEQAKNQAKGDVVSLDIDGRSMRVPASVAVSHLDRQASMAQTKELSEENRALRKQMHDDNVSLRTEQKSILNQYKDDAVMTGIVKNYTADPAIRQTEKMDQFANLIIDVADSDNPIGHASLETLMARASGEVGNLSEADKKPFGGSRALDEKMKQYFSEIYKGKKTPDNLKFISDLAKTFQASGRRKKAELAYERANQYSQANKGQGKSAEEIFRVLAPFDDYSTTGQGVLQGRGSQTSSGKTELRNKYGY